MGLFKSNFGTPTRVYVVGISMGGLIALKLIETWPGEFAGVLPVCAVSAGLTGFVDYALHVRVLFDLFYPGVLPGTAVEVPADIDVTEDIGPPAVAAMAADPSGALAIAQIEQTPVPFASGVELVQSIAMALGMATTYPQFLELTNDQLRISRDVDTRFAGTWTPESGHVDTWGVAT